MSLLLLVGCYVSSHCSVRAEDNRFDAIIDQIFDRHSDDDSEDEKPEPEVRPFPGNLSLVVGGGQRVVGQSLAERFGVSAIAAAGREDRPEVPVIWASPAVGKLQRLLAQPLKKEGFKFKDTPLSEVADFVRKEYEIKVLLDLRSLDDLGLSPDDKLDANLSEISLGAALKTALLQVDLTYILAHDTVVFVSEEEAFDCPLVGIYPVGDLLEVKHDEAATSKPKGLAQHPEDIARLKEIIEATCGVDSWGGGESYIVAMQPSLLIVRHREQVHVEIQDLLSALRLAKQHRFAMPLKHLENKTRPANRAKRKAKPKQRSGSMGGGSGSSGGRELGGGGVF
ncbi:hypothetical protein [Aeoliella sp. SH292]|uniref:hypothetical protein n=1 Tax=Aeoliella sp. SH292 TaxID=3454464 RepID=UPI003F9E0ABC